ncbi:MAG: c-type cytochrome [Candidatus Sumerlaeia bacterium]|nr:c-type cytochrome [Candidatus Sumerlaeia bacterium]
MATSSSRPTCLLCSVRPPALLVDAGLVGLAGIWAGVALVSVLAVVVARFYHPVEFAAATALVESGWPMLSTAALLVGALTAALAVRAALCDERAKAAVLLAVTVVAGADFVAVRVIEGVRMGREHAEWVRLAAQPVELPAGAALVKAPDAARGAELYGATCAACHGRQGEGVPRLGSPLAGSAFLKELDAEGMVAFLRTGRQPTDPRSLMRMVMPARGGNPMLTDGDLGDIAAFLEERLAAEAGAGNVAAATTPAAPVFERHRSAVPPAAVGPSGLSERYRAAHAFDGTGPIPEVLMAAPNRFPTWLMILTGLHGLLVAGGLVVLGALAVPLLRGPLGHVPRVALFLACAAYQMMAALWLVLVPFLYGPS